MKRENLAVVEAFGLINSFITRIIRVRNTPYILVLYTNVLVILVSVLPIDQLCAYFNFSVILSSVYYDRITATGSAYYLLDICLSSNYLLINGYF